MGESWPLTPAAAGVLLTSGTCLVSCDGGGDKLLRRCPVRVDRVAGSDGGGVRTVGKEQGSVVSILPVHVVEQRSLADAMIRLIQDEIHHRQTRVHRVRHRRFHVGGALRQVSTDIVQPRIYVDIVPVLLGQVRIMTLLSVELVQLSNFVKTQQVHAHLEGAGETVSRNCLKVDQLRELILALQLVSDHVKCSGFKVAHERLQLLELKIVPNIHTLITHRGERGTRTPPRLLSLGRGVGLRLCG